MTECFSFLSSLSLFPNLLLSSEYKSREETKRMKGNRFWQLIASTIYSTSIPMWSIIHHDLCGNAKVEGVIQRITIINIGDIYHSCMLANWCWLFDTFLTNCRIYHQNVPLRIFFSVTSCFIWWSWISLDDKLENFKVKEESAFLECCSR